MHSNKLNIIVNIYHLCEKLIKLKVQAINLTLESQYANKLSRCEALLTS